MNGQNATAYLAMQQQERNRPAVLAFPVLYPREVLTALDACVWERWSEPCRPCSATDPGKLQGYLCPTVRGAQAVLASGGHHADAVIIPHTCDSMQGLAAIALATSSWSVPIVTFRHPRGTNRPAARAFLRDEVVAFTRALETSLQRSLDPARLADAIALHHELETSLRRLLRRRPWLDVSDTELYAVLFRLTWMRPEDILQDVRALELRASSSTKRRPGVGLVVSGMVPEPHGWFDLLEEAGAYVAADDYAAFGRRLPAYPGPINDPFDAVVERLLLMPPCPTRSSDVTARVSHLSGLARESGARGVVLHTVKFCEPELFDVALVKRDLEQEGLKVLHIETEFETQVTGQIATRVEAFVEMLSEGD